MLKTTHALLPNGISDLLPAEAEKEAYAVNQLMNEFSSFGYQRVKLPLIEFEDGLFYGPGEGLERYTFRVMDAVSHKMMGVRADITPQVARLASSRFDKDDYPLRLMYAGDVLRVKASQLRPERQFCQVGCELIGAESVQADIEMILLPIIALDKMGFDGLSIDITLPAFIRVLLDGEHASDELLDALDKKDKGKILELNHPHSALIAEIMGMRGPIQSDLNALKNISCPQSVQPDIDRLIAVVEGVINALDDIGLSSVQLTIDPLERSVFEYHKGVSFTLFQKGARSELGRGGRYYFDSNEGQNTAIGFTLYMDSLRRIIPELSEGKLAQEVSAEMSWSEIIKLQQENKIIKRKL